MKKKIILLALGCFLAKNSLAMLEEIDLSADKNFKANLITKVEKKQRLASNCQKANRCCAFLDCLLGLLNNSESQSATKTIQRKKSVIPNE